MAKKHFSGVQNGTRSAIFGTPPNLHKDTLGAQIGPWKVIFGHYIDFGHFPIEIPIEAKKDYHHGKERS